MANVGTRLPGAWLPSLSGSTPFSSLASLLLAGAMCADLFWPHELVNRAGYARSEC